MILCSTKFFVRFTTVGQWLLQHVRRIHSPTHPISLLSILILSSHLNLGFSNLCPSKCSNWILYTSLISTIHGLSLKESGNVFTHFWTQCYRMESRVREISMYTRPPVYVCSFCKHSKMAITCMKMVTVCSYEASVCVCVCVCVSTQQTS